MVREEAGFQNWREGSEDESDAEHRRDLSVDHGREGEQRGVGGCGAPPNV